MELKRLLRVFRDRWYVVLGVGLLGLLAGWYFTTLANDNREEQIQATIAIRFETQEGQTADALETERDTTLQIAQQAAGDILVDEPTSKIEIDLITGRLAFRAIGNSEEEANEKARALLDAYRAVDPAAGGSIETRLEDVLEKAGIIEAQIAELELTLTPEEQALVDELAALDGQIIATEEALTQARVDEDSATSAELPEATSRRQSLEDALQDLKVERAGLGAAPQSALSIADQFRLSSLQNGLALLGAEYEQLNLRLLGIIDSRTIDPVAFDNLTGDPGNPIINGMIGLLGGVGLALFGLVFITRATKPVWLPEDLEIAFLGEVPSRRVGGGVGEAWYDTTEGGARKPAIQALRSVVEAQLPSTGATLAVTGHNVPAQGVHALTTDLAVSMASAGSSVLLVDADFASDSAMGEYKVGGSSLSGVLALNAESLGFERAVAAAVSNSLFIRPNLAVVPSGPPPPSPGDAIAGRQFRAFIEEATKHFDVVVVAVGDIGTPAAQVAMQRLRRSVLVLTPGRSTMPQVNGLVFDVVQRQVSILGAVFLQRSERALWGMGERRVETAIPETPHVGPTASPMSRLSHYPTPTHKGSPGLPPDSLQNLVDRVGSLQEAADANDFGRELLTALDGASPEVAFEAVADYLVSRVEDMMTASYGQGDFSDDVVDEVSLSGFLPFRSLTEHPSVGRWLMEELHSEVAPHTADAIVAEMEEILAVGTGRESVTVDDWLASEFFLRHLKRTNGDPSVWHLTSEDGTVQVLVPAHRFDRQKIENLMTQVTSRVIDELERNSKSAHVKGDVEQAALLEARVREVRRMETSLGLLLGITVDEETKVSRKRNKGGDWEWNPDWSAGYRANLAPLQRLGLLLFPVLTEDEMNSLLATG
jgi:Mrp family chromosome partitioning ATPase